MDIREVFARNLRRLRREKGWSQEGLAHEADVDRTYISALEREVYSASLDMVGKLAKVLDVEGRIITQAVAGTAPQTTTAPTSSLTLFISNKTRTLSICGRPFPAACSLRVSIHAFVKKATAIAFQPGPQIGVSIHAFVKKATGGDQLPSGVDMVSIHASAKKATDPSA